MAQNFNYLSIHDILCHLEKKNRKIVKQNLTKNPNKIISNKYNLTRYHANAFPFAFIHREITKIYVYNTDRRTRTSPLSPGTSHQRQSYIGM